jgi:beta-N-acetylhexosaminidase
MRARLLALMMAICVSAAAQQDTDSLDMKIGQMIMIGVGERTSIGEQDELLEQLRNQKYGGIILFEKNLNRRNTADSLKALIRALQGQARIPLFVSIDEEGGKVHRLKEKYGFFSVPSAAYLGKLDKADSTLYWNRKLSGLLAELGFNLNFTPSVDLALNQKNTVIVKSERSYSRDPEVVAKHAGLAIRAHHENGVNTTVKHFPGHGSSTSDSHLGITDVTSTWQRVEMEPYRRLMEQNLCDAVMVAHVINQNWDKLPATLSAKVVTGMLREGLGFQGVAFSDDMQMRAIGDNYGLERAITLAINAGIDVVVYANTLTDAQHRVTADQIHAIIKRQVAEKVIPRSRIEESYQRIMKLKGVM